MDEDVVLAFVVVGVDGKVLARIEVCDEDVEEARHMAVSSARREDYVLAVTAHSLVRLQPEPQIEIDVGPNTDDASRE